MKGTLEVSAEGLGRVSRRGGCPGVEKSWFWIPGRVSGYQEPVSGYQEPVSGYQKPVLDPRTGPKTSKNTEMGYKTLDLRPGVGVRGSGPLYPRKVRTRVNLHVALRRGVGSIFMPPLVVEPLHLTKLRQSI